MNKQLTLLPLVLLILTVVYNFTNIPTAFYLMGYAAIPIYLIAALAFFIPFALMIAEFGASDDEKHNGMYSWIERSIGTKTAFAGIFMWYASFVILLVNKGSVIFIIMSIAIFGEDLTHNIALLGLTPTQSIGLLGVGLVFAITFVSSFGIEKIIKITNLGGLAVLGINISLIIFASILLFSTTSFATPLTIDGFFTSPNPAYQGFMPTISFFVFAIFAYGGIELMAGISPQIKDKKRTIPLGVILASILIAVLYCIGIFLCALFLNYDDNLSKASTHLGNITYVAIEVLGYKIALALGFDSASASAFSMVYARFVGISMLLVTFGALFTIVFSPLKQLISSTPKYLWGDFLAKSKNNLPINAMYMQAILVSAFILLLSFGSDGVKGFFDKIILMSNVAITLPYVFISIAYPFFRFKDNIEKPFVALKSKLAIILATFSTTAMVIFANIATILEPYFKSNESLSFVERMVPSFYMIIGPVLFSVVAIIWIAIAQNKAKSNNSI